eukprot:352270-Chlamydomonas_euryale.AAC.3
MARNGLTYQPQRTPASITFTLAQGNTCNFDTRVLHASLTPVDCSPHLLLAVLLRPSVDVLVDDPNCTIQKFLLQRFTSYACECMGPGRSDASMAGVTCRHASFGTLAQATLYRRLRTDSI